MTIFGNKLITCVVLVLAFLMDMHSFGNCGPFHADICKTGLAMTAGIHANTKYDVIKLEDCSRKQLPTINCSSLPGRPKHVGYEGRGYSPRLRWNVSVDAGGDVSTLKGFLVRVSIIPFNGTPFPLECYYINITQTLHSQYVQGTFYFECNFTKQSRVKAWISSYPTPDMCPSGISLPQASIVTFFVPIVTDDDDTTRGVSTVSTTRSPSVIEHVILTTLACSLVFIGIIVSLICVWKKPCKGKGDTCAFRKPSSSQMVRLNTTTPSTSITQLVDAGNSEIDHSTTGPNNNTPSDRERAETSVINKSDNNLEHLNAELLCDKTTTSDAIQDAGFNGITSADDSTDTCGTNDAFLNDTARNRVREITDLTDHTPEYREQSHIDQDAWNKFTKDINFDT